MAKSGVYGIKELALAFRRLANNPMEKERREAREFAMEPVLTAARENLQRNDSIRTQALSDALAVGPHPENKNATVVGPRKGRFRRNYQPESYSHLVEFAVRPHWQPRRRRMHPGHPGYPFLRPAMDENKDEVARRYARKMGLAIEMIAARYGSRARRT